MADNNAPEKVTFLKKRRSQHKLKERDAIAQSQKAKAPSAVKNTFKRVDEFLRKDLKKAREDRRLRRIHKQKIVPATPDSDKVFLVVRTKTLPSFPAKCMNVFQELRLEKINTAVFIKASQKNLEKVQTIKPYVIFGEPSLKSVKSLIFKRGATLDNNKKVMLDNNTIVEEKLGELGLICLEDLVHEISTVGSNFESVAKFLEPIEFALPRYDPSRVKISSSVMDLTTEKEKAAHINQLISKLN